MSSFAAATHGIQSHHSTSTSNTSTSSISIPSSYSTPSATNHNNISQNYQQSNLHHHNSNHSPYQVHQGQSPLHYSTDIEQQSRLHHPNSQHHLVTSNDDESPKNIPLSPPISASEPNYLASPSSSGTLLSNAPLLPTSTIAQMGPITPPSSSGMHNIQGVGATASTIQLPQTPEDPIVLQQQQHLSHQHAQIPQHEILSSNHHHNPHVSVHQRLAPTIQPPQHHNSSNSGGSSHTLVAHQSGGGLIHTSSSASAQNRHSNPSSPLDADEDENQEHTGDLGDSNTSSTIDHGPSSGVGGRIFYVYSIP